MNTSLYVGAHVEAIKEARATILEILDKAKDPSVAVAALNAFAHICEVKNTNISGNTFTMSSEKGRKK